MGILPQFTGIACHDHWKPYFSYPLATHSLCNSHHLRELTYLEKQYDQDFAPKVADLLIEMNTTKQESLTDQFSVDTLIAYAARYDINNETGDTMSAISEKITNDVLSLPVEFRLELIDMLLKSLNIPTKPEIDELWARETEQRIDEVDSGSTQLVDGNDAFSRIRERLNK